jgi:predicted Zn-dependent protease
MTPPTHYRSLRLLGALFVTLSTAGCEHLDALTEFGTSLGTSTGVLSEPQANATKLAVEPVIKSFESITPEQEYYIGRTVGATLLEKYRPYENRAADEYLNLLGQALAQASDRPETFGGYRFLILDSDEINAFAAPGGLIFVTRGMIDCCAQEDALAAVLAHEIGHVELKHGLRAIRTARFTSALTTLAAEGVKTFGGADLAELTESFEGSVSDITSTLVNNGYSRALEQQADQAAVVILRRVGYNPAGLLDMLGVMERRLKPGGLDFARTHPSPQSRIDDLLQLIGRPTPVRFVEVREVRFAVALAGV